MMRGALIGMGVMTGLSACAPVPQIAPQSGSVVVAGQSYRVGVFAGAPGHSLTPAGAVAVAGRTVRAGPLGFDQGRRASEVARAACDQAGGRFQPEALGRHAGDEWIFEGGCA